MTTIKDILLIDGTTYQSMTDENRKISDSTFEKIVGVADIIKSFDSERTINIITNSPNHYLIIDTNFPQDLSDKIVKAFIESR